MTQSTVASGFQRPWFSVRIDAGGCPYDVRINDCPVMDDDIGDGITIRLPINIWLRPGENTLSVTLARSPRAKGGCLATVLLTEADRPKGDGPIMAELRLEAPPIRGGSFDDVSWAPDRLLRKRAVFTADVPFPRPRWDLAGPVDPSPADRQEIAALIRRFWEALRRRDAGEVADLLRRKSEELQAARYLTADERRAELESQLAFVFDPAEWRLADLDLSGLELRRYAEGRLFRAVDPATGESPVHFVDHDRQVATYLDLYVSRDPERRWHIIR